ncbi:hypothetical protein COO60DRAFT_281985 [Scenedesmus sp. NREL 46B-D3]|nr:hypothetical protein COO60DRAFT_281985 [Scenedesmus sp. NREL 46B-D3]
MVGAAAAVSVPASVQAVRAGALHVSGGRSRAAQLCVHRPRPGLDVSNHVPQDGLREVGISQVRPTQQEGFAGTIMHLLGGCYSTCSMMGCWRWASARCSWHSEVCWYHHPPPCSGEAHSILSDVAFDSIKLIQLSGGVANYVSSFKYLGGIVDTTATCDAEVYARVSKAKGRFAQMQRLWGMKNMSVSVKM